MTYVSVGTAARLLGIHRSTAIRWLAEGELRGWRKCRKHRHRFEGTPSHPAPGCVRCRYYVYSVSVKEHRDCAR